MKTDLIYGIEDRPPFKDALFAALQHLLAIFVAIITPPLIITSFLPLFIKSLQPDLNPVPSLSRSGRFFRNERTFTSVWQKYGPSSPRKR